MLEVEAGKEETEVMPPGKDAYVSTKGNACAGKGMRRMGKRKGTMTESSMKRNMCELLCDC
jgi:hypothetical protein